jgi:two-component system, NtrC family, response regulator AtoC
VPTLSLRPWLLLATTEPAPPPLLEAFAKEGLGVAVVDSRAAFEAALADRMVVAALVDLALPGSPLDTFRSVLAERAPQVPLVLIADGGSIAAAIEAVKAGARDYVMKPLVVEDVLFVVQGARASAAAAPAQAPWAAGESGGRALVGDSGPLRSILALVARAAPSQATVLIGGETGTGKELVARRIHELSPRSAGPLVKVQCGALPETLLESELYGYEKGAFTGATARKPGKVELAQGGTLFLDEIGDISPATQVKLLRVLQDREYERLGGTETRRADVRFVTATHRDLPAMVARGEFREDLYYRLNVVRIVLPPLRERLEDLPVLARHFAALACAANGLKPVAITESALEELRKERWPGNIRQLQNLIERLVVLSESDSLTAADVRGELAEHPAGESPPPAETAPREMSAIDLKGAVSKAEKRQIEKALLKSKGNRDLAARLLGISLRTLYYKLRVYGLE